MPYLGLSLLRHGIYIMLCNHELCHESDSNYGPMDQCSHTNVQYKPEVIPFDISSINMLAVGKLIHKHAIIKVPRLEVYGNM